METKMKHLHYSQMTTAERQRAREASRQTVGIRNRTGGYSVFTQTHGDATPMPEEQRDAVRFAHGVETQGHQTFTFGPDFGKLLDE
jgi:hypothetical protein